MKELVESMASVCSIYNVYFRNQVEKYELRAGEDPDGKVHFVSADPSHNIRRDHMPKIRIVVFGLQDMADMARSLVDMMNPGAHGHVLCSSLQFAF